jgi:hypothetical protein
VRHFTILIGTAFVVELAVAAVIEWPSHSGLPPAEEVSQQAVNSNSLNYSVNSPSNSALAFANALEREVARCDSLGQWYVCSP